MLKDYLDYLVKNLGSDLHIREGNVPRIRVDGELREIEGANISDPEKIRQMEKEIMTEEQLTKYKKEKNLDFAVFVKGTGRFRVNVFSQKGTTAFSIRKVAENIDSLEALELPETLKDIMKESRGLILVTGTTGSGKSTTVAAMLEYINLNYSKNIITLEDPIEYIFKDKKSIIGQREIPDDIKSYDEALKYVLRQDPDVIFIGELRDKETIDAALKAAETGHLVISTLHTVNAYQTITRIIDYYSEAHQKQIRYQLSMDLKAVVSQRLLPRKNEKGRVVAVEILRDTPSAKKMMLSPEGVQTLTDDMKMNRTTHKTQTFDQAIADLYLKDKISYEVAISAATVKKDIELLKSGIIQESASDYYQKMI